MINRGLLVTVLTSIVLSSHLTLAQTAPATAKKKSSARTPTAASAWTPDVQQYLGVSQGSFTMVGLNRLSKAQLEALISTAKNATAGDPKKHLLTCGPTTPSQPGVVRVWVTVSGDDAQGLRLAEIRQAIRGLSGVDVVDAAANADRALHIVIQEQTLGKRIIGYTASYTTSTPCHDDTRKADAEIKGQLGTYTDPKGADLARDLAGMLDQDLQAVRNGPR
ncbi:MAG: hypothetical protein PW789_10640 [Edaphobacter sp.]|uniref:hypothetical protein n=1 Tax=Edaphobacter sp. TaxID=1934404 RepID=UPI0023972D4F|nr:hypothetical protein [Edaphobacter sp.]MDE1177047.1 hypothetical protein [Edaphobacter sp.]